MSVSAPDANVSAPSGFVERCTLSTSAEGPLAAVRLAVKDNIEVRGRRYTAGHPLFSARRGAHTALAVRRLLQAGATLVGMTCTDAGGFGVTTPGVTNPLDPEVVVGGSSGGAAAVIAAGQADLGLGTDTGGSVRIPAACTGLFAYKPDYDAIATEGVWPLAASFDHVGLIASSGALLFRAAQTLLQSSLAQPTALERASIRVGVEADATAARNQDLCALMDEAVRALREAGYTLTSVELPDRDRMVDAHSTMTLFEAREVYRHLADEDRAQLGAAAISALKVALRLTDAQGEQARRSLAAIRASFAQSFAVADVLLLPTLSFQPPRQDEKLVHGNIPLFRALTYETCGFNIYGGPVCAFPCERSGSTRRIPWSLQLAAARCVDTSHLAWFDMISSDLSRLSAR